MDEKHEFALGCLILAIAIIMIPIAIAVLTHSPESYRIIEGDPVETAVEQAGLVVCSETATTWDVPGASGGKIYTISDNCETPSETVRVEVQAFDSANSRDAAIRAFHSNAIGKARPPGSMIVLGQYLVFVDSSGSSFFKKIAEKLDLI